MSLRPQFAGFLRWFIVLFGMMFPAMTIQAQGRQQVTGTVTASPEPSAFESDFNLTATLSLPSGGPAPTGTITFSIDGASVGTPATVNSATTTFAVTGSKYPIGSHTISAAYSGDSNYGAVTLSGTHVVRKLHSDIYLTITTPTFYYGQTLNGTASVGVTEASKDSTVNGGTTSFFVDNKDVCDLPLTTAPSSCPDNAGKGFNAGNHTFYATYSGNDYYDSSTSNTTQFTVFPDDTQTTIASSLNPAVFGQVVMITATVTAPYATPVGAVTFTDGGVALATISVDGTGKAVFQSSTLVIGSHPITATFNATQNFNASASGLLTQVITLPPPLANPTVTLLSSSANPSTFGQSVTFTASVGTTGAFIQVPTGTITFKDADAVLGTATLDASGNARYTTSTLAIGQHPITATYAGATGITGSVSAQLIQIVTSGLTSRGNGFLLTVTPTVVTVGVGATVGVDVNVLPLNNFKEPVKLSCANLPTETTCAFIQDTISIDGGTTKLMITPAAPHNCGSSDPYFIASGRSTALPMLAATAVFLIARRRRSWKGIALGLVLCLLPVLGGCGLGNCTDLGLKPGTYTFTVQGTSTGSAAITQTQTVQMTAHI